MSSITYIELYGDWTVKSSARDSGVILELRDARGVVIANTPITRQAAQTLALDLLDALNITGELYGKLAQEFDQ